MPVSGRRGAVLQRYYIRRNPYSQQIILVSTPQNRTNNAFPACDSTGQYGHLTRLEIGTGQQDAIQGNMGGLTLQTCSTSVSCPSSRHVHTPSSWEGFAPLIVPWRQDKQILSGTGFLPAAVFRSREMSTEQQGNSGRWPYGQLVRLAPLALPLPHQLPSLLNPRQCSTATDVGNHLKGYLATHTQTRTVLPRKHRVDVRVETGGGKICIW